MSTTAAPIAAGFVAYIPDYCVLLKINHLDDLTSSERVRCV